MKENKIFPWLVAIAAASISFSAAFYSIFGIGKMFAGASTNVMIMATSLEFAKLVIASFLYRFWNDVNKGLRAYLTIACFVLILITSAGIYGFLSSAYQDTANKVENSDKSTLVITKRKDMLQKQLDQAEKQLELKSNRQNTLSDMRSRQQSNADNLIASNKSASSVRTQMNQLSKESNLLDEDIKVLQDTIASKTQQISSLETEILGISTNSDLANEIGPLKYIAKLTGKTLDEVVNWFIIALMLVFDPLAIALVVAANFVFSYIGGKKKEADDFEVWKKEKEEEAKRLAEEEEAKRIAEEEARIKAEEEEAARLIAEEEARLQAEEEARIKAEEEEVARLLAEEETKRIAEEEARLQAEEEEIARLLAEEEEKIRAEWEEIIAYTPEEEEPKPFTIGGTPIKPIEEFVEESQYFEDSYLETESDYVSEESQDTPENTEEVKEEVVEEVKEEELEGTEEDGEFGGYKLGNVYRKKSENIKDYENMKDVPIDILVTKGDPTRL
jgi:murein DD-endopeptidase MepM/ murein hydrolase activator NlpD